MHRSCKRPSHTFHSVSTHCGHLWQQLQRLWLRTARQAGAAAAAGVSRQDGAVASYTCFMLHPDVHTRTHTNTHTTRPTRTPAPQLLLQLHQGLQLGHRHVFRGCCIQHRCCREAAEVCQRQHVLQQLGVAQDEAAWWGTGCCFRCGRGRKHRQRGGGARAANKQCVSCSPRAATDDSRAQPRTHTTTHLLLALLHPPALHSWCWA
jgi:hypothetical protein